MKVELIIFDCDGVLADSEIIAHQIGVDELARFGGSMTLEESIKLLAGALDEEVNRLLEEKCGEKGANTFLLDVENKIAESFKNTLKPIANIDIVMQYIIDTKVKRCVASNSMSDRLSSTLAITGLGSYFKSDYIYSASMVSQGKPEPDLFLYAADKMQVKPQSCLVIEDSVVGIAAAKAAKMPVIGFLGGTHAKYPWYKDRIEKMRPLAVVDDAFALLEILKEKI
jgi:beta-phosphoglucomutase-like phosphatase (HAD superfamily)